MKNNIINYGVASSGAVCSSYSNCILLTGVQPGQLQTYPWTIRKIPTIFAYAKKAGFFTAYIDMQNSRNKPNNFFQKGDWNNVDRSFFLSDDFNGTLKEYEKDLYAIGWLKSYLKVMNDRNTFTYFVKLGCHFSYLNKFPHDSMRFAPIFSDSGWGEWKSKNKKAFLNTYYNALAWEVDHFFEVLLRELRDQDLIIVYTSDHGQNLMDDMTIQQTHCAKGPAPDVMARVPLFIIHTKSIDTGASNAMSSYGHASHYNIFGTILYWMGYDKKGIERRYGPILLDDLNGRKRIYTSGDIFGRSKMYKNNFKNKD
jgi:glucan phosphoethanolaminetransferase (alkaline phosphatase superfamily)